MRLHLAFKNFKPAVIEATEALFAAKPWKAEPVAQVAAAQDWLNAVTTLYGLPPVEYVLQAEGLRDGTFYEPQYGDGPDEIRTTKFSIVNLFTAFAEHRGEHTQAKAGRNPSGWGYSLFYTVKPAMFRARVREGRIYGVVPRDLYTPETWARIQEADLDPTDKDVLAQLARINAGEDRSFGATEEMSASDEEAALEALEDDRHQEELESESDDAVDEPVPTNDNALADMNTRELRRYATAHGISGV